MKTAEEIIDDAICGHRLKYTIEDGDDSGLPVVDRLTPDKDDTITRGKEEIQLLTESIIEALDEAGYVISQKPEPLQPVKSLQEIKESLPIKYDFHSWHDEAAELYASQFKTPPVLQFNNNGPLANPINAKYEVINQDEMLDNLIYEIENLLSQMDYEKIISHLKYKYTIIPKQ